MNVPEEPATLLESLSEIVETKLEEPEIVASRVDWLAYVADKVLEERTNDHIEDLNNLSINWKPFPMECLKLSSTGFVFLSCGDKKLAEGLLSEVSRVDLSIEVVGYVVHQEGLEFPLEPKHALFGLHVYVKRAQDPLTLCVNVLHDVKISHVDRDADPVK